MGKTISIESVNPTCGHCQWFERGEGVEYGECFFNPPSALLNDDGSVEILRPIVDIDERTCSRFKGKH